MFGTSPRVKLLIKNLYYTEPLSKRGENLKLRKVIFNEKLLDAADVVTEKTRWMKKEKSYAVAGDLVERPQVAAVARSTAGRLRAEDFGRPVDVLVLVGDLGTLGRLVADLAAEVADQRHLALVALHVLGQRRQFETGTGA